MKNFSSLEEAADALNKFSNFDIEGKIGLLKGAFSDASDDAIKAALGITQVGEASKVASSGISGLGSALKGAFTSFIKSPAGIITAIAAITTAVVALYNYIHVTADEAREKLSDMQSNYDNTKSEIESLNSELETTQSRIDELNAKENLSLVEQEELTTLQKTNDELKRTLALQEARLKIQAQQTADEAHNTYKEWTTDDFLGIAIGENKYDTSEIERVKNNLLDNYAFTNYSFTLANVDFEGSKDNINELIGKYQALETEMQNVEDDIDKLSKSSDKNDLLQAESLNEYHDVLEEKAFEGKTYIDEYASVMQEVYDAYENAEAQGIELSTVQSKEYAEVKAFLTEYMKLYTGAASVESKINTLLSKADFIDVKDNLIEAGETSKSVLDGVIEKTPGLTEALDEAGISAQQLSDYIMAIADPDALRLDKVKEQLRETFTEDEYEISFKAGENADAVWNEFIDGKTDKEIEIFYKYINENEIDISNYSGKDLEAVFTAAVEGTENLEEAKNTLSSILSDDSEGNISEKIDTFQESMSSLDTALESFRNREEIDLTDLTQQFPELIGQTDNLQTAIGNLKADKLKEFTSQWRVAISDLEGDELESANIFFRNLVNGIDLSDMDFGNIKNEIISNILPNADDSVSRKVISDTWNQLYSQYSDSIEGKEAVYKLSLDPSNAYKTVDELSEMVETTIPEIKIAISEKNVTELQNKLSNLQIDASQFQDELSFKESTGVKPLVSDYQKLIKNSRLQIKNLQDTNVELQNQLKLLDQTDPRYQTIRSEIQSNISAINEARINQLEWNKAVDQLSYEPNGGLSDYNTAKESRNTGDNYLDMLSAAEEAQEARKKGLIGTDDFKTAAKMFSPNGMDDVDNWDENYSKITRYFTEDEEGVINFLEDLKGKTNKAGEALAELDETTGDWSYNIEDVQGSADALGISFEAFLAIMGRLQDYGFTNDFFSSIDEGQEHLADLYTELTDAELKMQELEKARKNGDETVTDTVLASQEAKINQIRQSIMDSQTLLEQLSSKSSLESTADTKSKIQAALTSADVSTQITDSIAQQKYLSDLKDSLELENLEIGLVVEDPDGTLKIAEDVYNQLVETYGQPLEITTQYQDVVKEDIKNSLSSAMEDETSDLKTLVDSLSGYTQEQFENITFGDGEYGEFEGLESTIDNILGQLGLTQEEGTALLQVLGEMELIDFKVDDSELKESEQDVLTLQDAIDEKHQLRLTVEKSEPLNNLLQMQENGVINAEVNLAADTSSLNLEDLNTHLEGLESVKVVLTPDTKEYDYVCKQIENTKIQIAVKTKLEEGTTATELLELGDEELSAEIGCELNEEELDNVRAQLSSIAENEEIPITVKLTEEQMAQLAPNATIPIDGNNEEAKKKVDEVVTYAKEQTDAIISIDGDGSEAITEASTTKSEINDMVPVMNIDANTSPLLLSIDNALARDFSINVTANLSGGPPPLYTGTMLSPAHASGTAYNVLNYRNAYANGSIALGKDEEALVNELGTESIIRQGKWMLIPGGMHVQALKRGDIVLNHLQTANLIKSGKAFGAGKMYGSAYASGTSYKVKNNGKFNIIDSSSSSSTSSEKVSATTTPTEQVSDATEKSTSALEKFQEWFSKLFDWIEVKLERQTQKISRYLTKAENALDSQNYKSSAKNYFNAIKASSAQVKYESQANDKYETQANTVLSKAVSQGVISSDTAKSIKTKVQNGTMDIKEYSEEIREVISSYQEWYEKSVDTNDAVTELHNNIRTYINDLKDLRDTQRDAKLESLDTYSSIGTSGYTSTSGRYSGLKNSQLRYTNAQLKSQNAAYSAEVTNVSSDVNNLKKSAKSFISTQLKSSNLKKAASDKKKRAAYKKALQNAQKAIKSKKKVASSDLNTIKKYSIDTYERIYAYNLSLDNLEIAKLERATNYAATSSEIYQNIAETYENADNATDNKISLYKQKADNSSSVKKSNSYLKKAASQYDTLLSDDKKEIKKYSTSLKSKQKIIAKSNSNQRGSNYNNLNQKEKAKVNKYIDKAQAAAKAGNIISASVLSKLAQYYSKGYITAKFYQACIDYNNALESKRESEAQYAIDQETAKAEKAAIGTQMVSNVEQTYTNKLNSNAAKTQKIETAQSLKTTRGLSLNKKDYQDLINQSKIDQQLYNDEAEAIYAQIQKNLANGYWSTSSQEYKDAMQSYNDYKNKSNECVVSQEEWNNAIAELPYQELENTLDLLDAIADYNKSLSNLKSAKGLDLSESDYLQQISDNNDQIKKLTQEQSQAWKDYLTALANVDGVYGGKTANEWLTEYKQFGTEINNLKSDNEDLKDTLRDDVYWRAYERAHDACQRYADVLSGLKDLIDDTMYFDKDGNLTQYGVAQIANLVSEYENAQREVKNYSNDIANLNKLYSEGHYTEEEYKEKLAGFQTSLLSSAGEMKSVINEITDMYKTMGQAELDSLFEIIDARNEALSAKKAYYDYDKTISSKTKDIQNLQAQLAALEGIETAEAKAGRATIQAQLSEAQDDLNDTINEHMLELSQDSLDDLKDTLQDAFDDKWDTISSDLKSISELMASANALTASSANTINNTLNELLKYYGVNPVSSSIQSTVGYASGTSSVKKTELAWTQEKGKELIVRPSDSAILTPVKQGDIIPNAELSSNLFAWGGINPQDFAKSLSNIPTVPRASTSIVQNYDSLINVEGNMDSVTGKEVIGIIQKQMPKIYNYTVKEIARDARKVGIKV